MSLDISNLLQVKQTRDHFPVLIQEFNDYLQLHKSILAKNNQNNIPLYVDGTFGAGGYSELILQNTNANLIATDRDSLVFPYKDKLKSLYQDRFNFFHSTFSSLPKILSQNFNQKIDGLFLDLGLSTMQLKDESRGFSFNSTGDFILEMGLNEISTVEFLTKVSEKNLSDIIYYYGEDFQAKKIAKAIIDYRNKNKLFKTKDLVESLRQVLGYKRKNTIDPLTKTFQALRIHINQELKEITDLLQNIIPFLNQNAIIIVVSFHSLEDKIIKDFFKNPFKKNDTYITIKDSKDSSNIFTTLTKKIITPNDNEVKINPPSSSSRMRVALYTGNNQH